MDAAGAAAAGGRGRGRRWEPAEAAPAAAPGGGMVLLHVLLAGLPGSVLSLPGWLGVQKPSWPSYVPVCRPAQSKTSIGPGKEYKYIK